MSRRLQGIGMTSRRTRERMIARLRQQGITNGSVLAAMAETPRHIFVDEALESRAYEDTALPIGHNQTISQPYIVAKMTELLLEYGPRHNVLEIGTGCGYQTAILAKLVGQLYSVERIAPLMKKARDTLWELGIKTVGFKHSDGGWGWPEHAPFDGILAAAAPPEIPSALLEQLAVGGVMVIPVGLEGMQELHRITRTEHGFEDEVIERVSFVPFLSGVSR
ncbi:MULTISPECIES: protein-L-isoaspartate(D-aspartate) O-methyltransferase [Methylomonas]|uniref:Protein-L-isoaspartate O-methyltransferase n=1 Tax=Methylomonas koyamae TaxID=702114 RepID=A0A177NMM6_9GAMM|nr:MULTISPECIES: protein-L-isoaspartate(D-aspartate) O-methyltransferase [Methylomonas]ANE56810.1 protein-L-isoaspartate O-methyltransferase [Methylomonas sp. DH-1]OAI19386.1 protein-L-isoaspartate O-methyltransferase [Methylomonas koyamae]WNB75195.1 protein-L-isoaspartate(D-aspartate) O-methyltransferase [Methylomonas koyamae]BBL59968.1 protein-L-isoaspartate O-methyltransferase [Methylomonas koyamae]